MRTLMNPTSLENHLPPGKKVATLFMMSSCPFCRRFRPVFESFAKSNADGFDFLAVVLDDLNNLLWDKYRIGVVPTVVVFQEGKTVLRLDGRPNEGLNSEDLGSL